MTKHYLVWDLPLRLFHWLFVLTLIGLWYSSDQERELLEYHLLLGYFALGLVLFRLCWGFLGTRHAQFKHFIPSFSDIKSYITQHKSLGFSPSVGHNPLGALMVVALLSLVLLQAISGLFIDDDIFTAGPYFGVLTKQAESIMVFIHHNAFDLIIIFSALHIGAVFYYLWVKKQNLIKPMFTGKKTSKELTEQEGITHSKIVLAIIIAVAVVLFVYWLVVLNAPVVEEFY